MRPGGAILQAFHAFGPEARHPLVHCFAATAFGRLSLVHLPHQFGSTMRGQPDILMNVHPVLEKMLKLRNPSFPAQNRMDNLMKARI
jgi:hypothetical protein